MDLKTKWIISCIPLGIITILQLTAWIMGLQAVYFTESISDAKIWIGASLFVGILRTIYRATIHDDLKKRMAINQLSS